MKLLLFTILVSLSLGFSCSNRPAGKSRDNGGNCLQGRIVRIRCQPLVEVNRNDSLILQFAERPGRGYSWISDNPATALECLEAAGEFRLETIDLDDPEQIVEFHFRAVREGEETLKFRYLRPWELNKPAFDSCKVVVVIR